MDMYDQNERGRRGIGGRIFVALIIALIALFMYMFNTQENPVTGERQHVSLTPVEEIKLGLDSAPEMAREMGGELPGSDPRLQEVRKIGQYIVDNTDAKKGPWKFQFHLLNDTRTINAFALPGGQVFITLGLYDKLKTEAQLAGVLSHEMGHVIERHSAQQMATSQLGQMLVVAVGTGASDSQDSARQAMMVASMVNQMFQLRYSRKDESQADIWGLKLMSQVGYNPRAMIEVMEILKAAGAKGAPLQIFQTHPDPDQRIKDIEEYLKKHPQDEQLKLRKAYG